MFERLKPPEDYKKLHQAPNESSSKKGEDKLEIRTCILGLLDINDMWDHYPDRTKEPQCSRFLVPYEKDNKFHRDIKGHNPDFFLGKAVNPEMVLTELEYPKDLKEFRAAKKRMHYLYLQNCVHKPLRCRCSNCGGD